jgi:hypothetical protein
MSWSPRFKKPCWCTDCVKYRESLYQKLGQDYPSGTLAVINAVRENA